jgi:hypothetical protein
MTLRFRLIAEPNTILRGLVGSTVHGLVLSGTDDRDEMGVCVEPRRYVVGFGKFEQWVYRSAAEREGNAGARSQAGDLDLADVLAECTQLESRIDALLDSSPLPLEPDLRTVERFVTDTYADAWAKATECDQ